DLNSRMSDPERRACVSVFFCEIFGRSESSVESPDRMGMRWSKSGRATRSVKLAGEDTFFCQFARLGRLTFGRRRLVEGSKIGLNSLDMRVVHRVSRHCPFLRI